MSSQGAAMARRRNRWGTLDGGEQNESMQQYVVGETMADKEHKRWLAHKDAALHATFPTSIELNGVTIPIFKMKELEQLDRKRLKERALNTRDLVNATESRFFEHYPRHTLNPNAHPEVIMRWFIDVQVALAQALGEDDLTHAAFGASERNRLPDQRPGERSEMLTQLAQARNGLPSWSQEAMLTEQQQRLQTQQMQQQQQQHSRQPRTPPQSFPWSQHGVVEQQQQPPPQDWRQATPQHQGFSLVPPHLQQQQMMMGGDETRSHDAAYIRQRSMQSSFAFG